MHTEIRKLLTIRALRAFMIIMPIMGLYFVEHGLSIRDIFVLQVIFSIAIVLLEVPTGYFADRFGRKTSIAVSTACAMAGYLTYALTNDFWGFALAEILLAVCVGFISGADSSFLYETLREGGQEKLHVRYQGRLLALVGGAECVAAFASYAVLHIVSMQSLFFIQTAIAFPALILALMLREPKRLHTHKPTALEALRHIRDESARIRRLNVFAGSVAASTLVMVWMTQPYWATLGIPATQFGILWGLLQLVIVVGALIAAPLERRLSFKTLFGTLGISIAVLFGLLAALSGSMVALAVIPFFWLVRSISNPIMQDYVSREAPEALRATVLSLNSLYARFIFSVFSPFIGWIADVWSFQASFAAAAVVFGTITFVSYLSWYALERSRTLAHTST